MTTLAKRIITGVALGTLAGVGCAWGAATHGVPGAFHVTSAMFWFIVLSRLTLGFVLGVVGTITTHPLFTRVHMGPVLRGTGVGILFSLPYAASVLIGGAADRWGTFWTVIVFGIIIGAVIDTVLTRFFGQTKHLLDCEG